MSKQEKGTLILSESQMKQKIKRIAFQIYENNYTEESLILAGINGTGYQLAKILKKELEQIVPFEISLIEVTIDKKHPIRGDIKLDKDPSVLDDKVVIMVDDVQNTGKTFAYGMRPLLNQRIKKLEVAVLVNRAHTAFPVTPNYTGYELSTTLNDHIKVVLENKHQAVYLS